MDRMRLDRLVASAAGLGRSGARRAIAKGQVTVGGACCRQPDAQVDPAAALALCGRPLTFSRYLYLMLDKPQGVVSASRDAAAATVTDLVAGLYPKRALFPAGRLDKDSTGFVLLTDDGPFAHALLSPRRGVEKEYLVTLDGPVGQQACRGFAAGVTLADGQRMDPAGLWVDPADSRRTRVTLHQGVYHQIKRMFGVYGLGVTALRRVSIGGVLLDETLGPGGCRPLAAAELSRLRRAAGLEDEGAAPSV